MATGPTSARARPLALWRWPAVWPAGAVRLWRRNAVLYRRSWTRSILPNFFEPVLYLLSIGLGLGLYVGSSILGYEYVVFIAPGLIAAAAMNGATFEVTYNVFVKLRFARLYDAVVTTPLEPEDVALGELFWGLTRSLIYGTVFLVVTAVLGYVESGWAVLAPLAIALTGLAFCLVGLIVTSLIPSIDLYSYFFSLFVTPLFLFSGIFFPLSDLPGALQPVAWLTPLWHGVELLRTLTLDGYSGPLGAAGHALWLLGFSALLYPPAINLLRRRLIT